jgi:hypothetical protein
MITSLSLALASILTSYATPYPNLLSIGDTLNEPSLKQKVVKNTDLALNKFYTHTNKSNVEYTLHHEATTLSDDVIKKVLTALTCAKKYKISHNQILTVIDYSLPSNKKRLWVFDLENNKLLYHTYVGHGIKSGTLLTDNFSNKHNSKATSLGVYRTEGKYYGRAGVSLRLQGLDRNFNDNASGRYIVMHGGWYMDDAFIKKYGRSGRSWGCPALPIPLAKPIIDTIKDKSLMIVYYPSDKWFAKSKFLNCNHKKAKDKNATHTVKQLKSTPIPREYVLFAALNKNKAIIAVKASQYAKTFSLRPPLKRMLRRRIGTDEYIALSNTEIEQLIFKSSASNERPDILDDIKFVIPVVKMRRGYYATDMVIVKHKKIKDIAMLKKASKKHQANYIIHFESGSSIKLSATNRFIRWLGL